MTGFRFMLDTSAILAYDGTPAAIDAGELIAEASTEQLMVGVPVLCLTEAMRAAGKPERYAHFHVLLALANVTLVPLTLPTAASCQDFANLINDLGDRADLAAAALAATQYTAADEPDSVYVITAFPEAYGASAPVVGIN